MVVIWMTKSYSELITLTTFEERYEYLKIGGFVGQMTFGGYREVNQMLYKNSSDWRTIDPRKEGLIWFGNWKTFWSYEHPRCWKQLTSKEIADDILGLN